jgi:hypothetical protein
MRVSAVAGAGLARFAPIAENSPYGHFIVSRKFASWRVDEIALLSEVHKSPLLAKEARNGAPEKNAKRGS